MKAKLAFAFAFLLFLSQGVFAACTATEQSADYSPVGGSTSTLSTGVLSDGQTHTMNVNSNGDLVVITAWCFQNCTFPATIPMDTQNAVKTSVVTPGTTIGIDGLHTGQAAFYYVLNAIHGNHTITLTVTGGATQTQVSYIDFKPSAGCSFSHDVDSPVGAASHGGGVSNDQANTPSISGVTGDILVSWTVTTQHVNSPVNAPWSCPQYLGQGETQTCNIDVTQNGQAYVLSASSGTTSNSWTLINSSTGYEAIITSFKMTQQTANACPTGATYGANGNQTLAALGITSCRYVASYGLDTATGQYETDPWLLAPGMGNCASNCLTERNTLNGGATGVGIILRGGDTWHFGNSSASPYTGLIASGNGSGCDAGNSCGWTIGGSSNAWGSNVSNPLYFGVDKTWWNSSVCGVSWCRPIMNGDNPTSTTGVASCPHDLSTFSFIKTWTGTVNVIIDNFEFTGTCWSGTNRTVPYVDFGNTFTPATNNRTIENSYFHGWSHVTFGVSSTGQAVSAINEPSANNGGIGDVITHNIFDGSDTDEKSYSGITFGGYDIDSNVFRYMTQGCITNNTHTMHDNVFDHLYGYSDGLAHGNGCEFNTENNTDNVVYNNIWSNFAYDGVGCGNEQFQTAPQSGRTTYFFNNVIYGWGCGSNGNYLDICGSPSPSCSNTTFTINAFNNTMVMTNGGLSTLVATAPSTIHINFINNHCISPATPSSCILTTQGATIVQTTNLLQTTANATSQGYNATQTYAYSPTLGTNSSVGFGTNETTSLCSPLVGSGDSLLQAAGAACELETGYSCTLNLTNHTVSCPAIAIPVARPSSGVWDAGAYEFSAGAPQVATPSISPVAGTYTSPQTVTITDSTGGATICYTTDGTTPTANGAGTCTHGSTYSGLFLQSLPATVEAIGSESGFTDSSVATASYSPSSVATYYISKSTGSDSNAGTSKTFPWQHLPGMKSWSGTHAPVAGDVFILMGCDTWVNSDFPVNWDWSGVVGNPIKITTDNTWYNSTTCPSGWNRPIFDAQGAVITGGVVNGMFIGADATATSYVTVDDIEWIDLFSTGGAGASYIKFYNDTPNWTITNNYMHDLKVVLDSAGDCALLNPSANMDGSLFEFNVISGSDRSGQSPAGGVCDAFYSNFNGTTIAFNVVHDIVNFAPVYTNGNPLTIAHNLIYNILTTNNGGVNHCNAIETLGGGTVYIVDNIIHDMFCSGGEAMMIGNASEIDYVANNVIWNLGDSGNAQTTSIPQTDFATGLVMHFFNNTIVSPGGQNCINYSSKTGVSWTTLDIRNNHCINASMNDNFSSMVTGTYTTTPNTTMTTATATAQGYNASQTFAYSPTSGTNGTVGAGSNLTSVWPSGFTTDDTDYSCSQQTISGVVQAVCPARTSNTRPASGAWDNGAYEFSGALPGGATGSGVKFFTGKKP